MDHYYMDPSFSSIVFSRQDFSPKVTQMDPARVTGSFARTENTRHPTSPKVGKPKTIRQNRGLWWILMVFEGLFPMIMMFYMFFLGGIPRFEWLCYSVVGFNLIQSSKKWDYHG